MSDSDGICPPELLGHAGLHHFRLAKPQRRRSLDATRAGRLQQSHRCHPGVPPSQPAEAGNPSDLPERHLLGRPTAAARRWYWRRYEYEY
eukprot:scaffold16066_cov36-Prasinocladus_malaysianus.AAC.1